MYHYHLMVYSAFSWEQNQTLCLLELWTCLITFALKKKSLFIKCLIAYAWFMKIKRYFFRSADTLYQECFSLFLWEKCFVCFCSFFISLFTILTNNLDLVDCTKARVFFAHFQMCFHLFIAPAVSSNPAGNSLTFT